jgi:extracellular elastinolytic metalloproteinase
MLAASLLMAPLSHAEESQSRMPSYIEADRTQAEQTLGGPLANDVFLDRFKEDRVMIDRLHRRDVIKGSAAIVLTVNGAFWCGWTTEARGGVLLPELGVSPAREVDTRDFRRSRLTSKSVEGFHSRAESISDCVPGPQRVRITSFDRFTGLPSCLVSDHAPVCAGDWLRSACDHVQTISHILTEDSMPSPTFEPIEHVVETGSGARVVHLLQREKDIPVFQSSLMVRFDPLGRLTDCSGTVSACPRNVSPRPLLTVEEAALHAARHVGTPRFGEHPGQNQGSDCVNRLAIDLDKFVPKVRAAAAGAECATVLEPGPFGAPVTAHLTWFDQGDRLLLAWTVVTAFSDFVAQYLTLLDAQNGAILYCRQLVNYMAGECPIMAQQCDQTFTGNIYRMDPSAPRRSQVFPMPISSVNILYNLNLPLPNDSRPLPNPFPNPWITGYGYAYYALGNYSNPLGPFGEMFPPVVTGGNDVLFDAADPFGLDQQLLNAFYAAGMARDILYYLGFREADGNAQVVNWDRGGLPNDRPDIRIAAGPAYAFTPVDGQIPTIVLGTEASTGRPHALDATVVIHEYTHILTNRLVGGPLTWGTLDAAQSQGLSEGWSDYVPCTLFNIDVIGAWVSNNPNGQRGIPYDSNYPGTFGSLGIGWYDERLFTGQIWAATLLEMARHADRSILLQVVVDSLKLVVPNPNFLQARDAMYLALTNMQTANRVSAAQASAVRSAMQSAFARFGMGQNAVSLGNLLRYITPDFILNGQSLKPPVKVIGLGGVSPDGTAAYAQGNDGSLWRNLSGTWTQALAPGFPQQRFWKVYRITSGGAQAIVFGESSTWGSLALSGTQWSWTPCVLPDDAQDIAGVSNDGKVIWWMAADIRPVKCGLPGRERKTAGPGPT